MTSFDGSSSTAILSLGVSRNSYLAFRFLIFSESLRTKLNTRMINGLVTSSSIPSDTTTDFTNAITYTRSKVTTKHPIRLPHTPTQVMTEYISVLFQEVFSGELFLSYKLMSTIRYRPDDKRVPMAHPQKTVEGKKEEKSITKPRKKV